MAVLLSLFYLTPFLEAQYLDVCIEMLYLSQRSEGWLYSADPMHPKYLLIWRFQYNNQARGASLESWFVRQVT